MKKALRLEGENKDGAPPAFIQHLIGNHDLYEASKERLLAEAVWPQLKGREKG